MFIYSLKMIQISRIEYLEPMKEWEVKMDKVRYQYILKKKTKKD